MSLNKSYCRGRSSGQGKLGSKSQLGSLKTYGAAKVYFVTAGGRVGIYLLYGGNWGAGTSYFVQPSHALRGQGLRRGPAVLRK